MNGADEGFLDSGAPFASAVVATAKFSSAKSTKVTADRTFQANVAVMNNISLDHKSIDELPASSGTSSPRREPQY